MTRQTATHRKAAGWGAAIARSRVALAAVAIAGAAVGAWVPPATAGTYTAWFCRNGANESTEGIPDWFHSTYGVGNYIWGTGVVCQTIPPYDRSEPFNRGVLVDGANNPSLVIEDMSVQAPADLTLTNARLWWKGQAGVNGQVTALAPQRDGSTKTLVDRRNGSFPTAGDPDTATTPTDSVNLDHATALTLRAACLSNCQTEGTPTIAEWFAYRVAVTVDDSAAPAGQAQGSLLVDPVLKGQPIVSVDATDKGGGVYLAQAVADGQVRASTEFGDLPCRDIDATNTDPFEFSRIQPCPSSGSATVALDTTQLGEDLYHDIEVRVVDAAGDATVVARRTVGVDNKSPARGFFDRATRRFQNPLFNISAARQLNGTGASSGAHLRVYLPVTRTMRVKRGKAKGTHRRITRAKAKRTVGFNAKPTLRAVLTDASRHAISGASVWMATRAEGSDWQIVGRPRITSSTGRVGFRLPAATPSRQINLVYFPFSDSHEQVLGRPVTLKVRAGVTLAVDRRSVRNGQRVKFRGGVMGLRPGRGVTASLQVKLGARYTTFRQVRLRPVSGGRFRTAYRFKDTTRPTRYRFRLVVLKQAGLPYERGVSPTRTVLVTP